MPTVAPRIVNSAFWLAIVGLSIIVLVSVIALAAKEQTITLTIEAQAQKPPDQRFSPEQIRGGITLGVWLNLGFSVVLGLLAAYFVREVRAGDRRSRTRFTVVAGLITVMLFFLGSLLALVGLLCVLVAVGLLFSATSTRFLNE
ncbi:hypothetical protein ALI144C_45635 [Actinosynnema sp. ALI-1.44]|nr:hypothetical protein ALI144C_45635 [Actinosynnema sp. ALI-1.44]